MKIFTDNSLLKKIAEIARSENFEAYVIGGYVRDLIIKRTSKDIDIVVVGSGIEFAKVVSKHLKIKNISIFKNYGTAQIKFKDHEIEFVGARRESYQLNSRKPFVESGSLKDDQNRRDFTINALAISLKEYEQGQIIDPFNGQEDIKNKSIRTPTDPLTTFSDDPLRMMRAIRFAAQLGFKIEENTLSGILKMKDRIQIISKERISDELNKILLSTKPSVGFNYLDKTGLLNYVLKDLENLKGVETIEGKGHKDNFHHTLQVVDNISIKSNNLWLRWAALLHDIAKSKTKKYSDKTGWTFHGHEFYGSKMVPGIFKSLRLPLNEKMKYVQKLVLLHLRPIVLAQDIVTDSAVRRLLFDAGDDIDDLMLLCDADITSKNPKKVKKYLDNFKLVRKKLKEVEEKDKIRNWQPPISGDVIIKAFDMSPSKEVGIIKNAIKDAILDGVINNDYESAYQFMLQKGEELGLNSQNKS